jgi:hypothetical protein
MEKYKVLIYIVQGEARIEVEANDPQEARQKGIQLAREMKIEFRKVSTPLLAIAFQEKDIDFEVQKEDKNEKNNG